MTAHRGKGKGEKALYVLEFRSYTNPRVWIRSFEFAPFSNPTIAQQTADEATKKRGDKYRVIKYVRDWTSR